jgi:hypothetical protein
MNAFSPTRTYYRDEGGLGSAVESVARAPAADEAEGAHAQGTNGGATPHGDRIWRAVRLARLGRHGS